MHDGDADDGGFLVIPATGITLILIGVGCLILAAFPDLIPYLASKFLESLPLPPELTSFLLSYFLPEVIQPTYLTVTGIGAIAAGTFFSVQEYREYLTEKRHAKEQ